MASPDDKIILCAGKWLLNTDEKVQLTDLPVPDPACCCPYDGPICCDFTPEFVPTPLTVTVQSGCATIDGDTFLLYFFNGMGIVPSRVNCWEEEGAGGEGAGADYDSGANERECGDAKVRLCCCEDGGLGDNTSNCLEIPTNDNICRSFCLTWAPINADGCIIFILNDGFPVQCSCDPFELTFLGEIRAVVGAPNPCPIDDCLCVPGTPVTILIQE